MLNYQYLYVYLQNKKVSESSLLPKKLQSKQFEGVGFLMRTGWSSQIMTIRKDEINYELKKNGG